MPGESAISEHDEVFRDKEVAYRAMHTHTHSDKKNTKHRKYHVYIMFS